MSDFASLTVPRGKVRPAPGIASSIGASGSGTTAIGAAASGAASSGGSAGFSLGERLGSYAVPAVAAVSAAAVVVSFAKLLLQRRERRQMQEQRQQERRNRTPPRVGAQQQQNQQQRDNANNGSPRLPGDKYVKMEEIGRGAYGVVFVGRHHRTGQLVAIKEMDGDASDELRVEYELMQGLHHPNIVDILGFEVHNGRARLYLEWVAGGSLHEHLQKHGPIEEEDLLRCYARQLLLGLKFLHDHGILHRDLKPRNTLIDHRGTLKLTDFGLSRHAQSMQAQTRAAGTPAYMDGSAVRGRFSVGTDIWALGATLSEMATGRMPWSHLDRHILESPMSLLFHIANLQGQRGHHPEIPRHLSAEGRAFFEVCFAPFPEQRGTCDELLAHPWLRDVASPSRAHAFSPQNSLTASAVASATGTGSGSGGSGSGKGSGKGSGAVPETRGATATYSMSTDSSMRGTGYLNRTPPPPATGAAFGGGDDVAAPPPGGLSSCSGSQAESAQSGFGDAASKP